MVIRYDYDQAAAEGRAPRATDRVTVLHGDINPSLKGYGPDPEGVKTMQSVMHYTPEKGTASSYVDSVELSEAAKQGLDCLGSAAALRDASSTIRAYFTGAQSNRLDELEYGSPGGRMFSLWREDAVASCLLYGATASHVDVFVPPSFFAQVSDQDRTKILRSAADKMGKLHLQRMIDVVSVGQSMPSTAYAAALSAGKAVSHAWSEYWGLEQVDNWTHGIPEGLEPNDMQMALFEVRRRIPSDFEPDPAVPKVTLIERPWEEETGAPRPREILETVTMSGAVASEIEEDARAEFNTLIGHLRTYMSEQQEMGKPLYQQTTTKPSKCWSRDLGKPTSDALNTYFSNDEEGDLSECLSAYITPWGAGTLAGRLGIAVPFNKSENVFRLDQMLNSGTRQAYAELTGTRIHVADFPADCQTDWLKVLAKTVSNQVPVKT